MRTSIGCSVRSRTKSPYSGKAKNVNMTLATRLAVAMIALVAIAISAVGWLSYRNVERTVLPRVLDRIEAQSRLGANEIESYASRPGAAQGHCGLSGPLRRLPDWFAHASTAGLIRSTTPPKRSGASDLRVKLAVQMALKPAYSLRRQSRGRPSGNRSHRPLGTERRHSHRAEAELKQVGDALVPSTISLSPGQVYVSPVHLNDENASSRPRMCRSCRSQCRSSGDGGKPFGIVIVDADMQLRARTGRVRSSARPDENVHVVDDKGNYPCSSRPRP